jgi:hypothetical protein
MEGIVSGVVESLKGHIDALEKRIERLEQKSGSDDISETIESLMREEL